MNSHFLDLTVEGAPGEALVNGIPACRIDPQPGHAFRVVRPLDAFLLPGGNRLELRLDTGPTPSRALEPHEPGAPGRGEVAILACPSPDFDRDRARRLAGLEWGEPPATSAPDVRGLDFDLPGDRPVPLWAQLDPVTSLAGLAEHVAGVQAALDRGDIEALIEGQRAALELSERAGGFSVAAVEATLRRALPAMLAGKPVTPPLPQQQWDLRPVADRRLVEVIGADWMPVPRRGEPPEIMAMETRLGLVQGRWTHLV